MGGRWQEDVVPLQDRIQLKSHFPRWIPGCQEGGHCCDVCKEVPRPEEGCSKHDLERLLLACLMCVPASGRRELQRKVTRKLRHSLTHRFHPLHSSYRLVSKLLPNLWLLPRMETCLTHPCPFLWLSKFSPRFLSQKYISVAWRNSVSRMMVPGCLS